MRSRRVKDIYHYVHAADWPAEERDREAAQAGGLHIVETWNRMAYLLDHHARTGRVPPDWQEVRMRPLEG